jgi:hypothetical protein
MPVLPPRQLLIKYIIRGITSQCKKKSLLDILPWTHVVLLQAEVNVLLR